MAAPRGYPRELVKSIGEICFDEAARPDLPVTDSDYFAAGQSGILTSNMIFRLGSQSEALQGFRSAIGDNATLWLWRAAQERSAKKDGTLTRQGRCEIYIPKNTPKSADHWIVRAVGWENARILCREFGSSRYDLPNGSEVRREEARVVALQMIHDGCTPAEVSKALSNTYPVSEGWVINLIRQSGGGQQYQGRDKGRSR